MPCRPMKCGTRMSPPARFQPVIGMPPPPEASAPMEWLPLSSTGSLQPFTHGRAPGLSAVALRDASAQLGEVRSHRWRFQHLHLGAESEQLPHRDVG